MFPNNAVLVHELSKAYHQDLLTAAQRTRVSTRTQASLLARVGSALGAALTQAGDSLRGAQRGTPRVTTQQPA
jgi:hypothetical protein